MGLTVFSLGLGAAPRQSFALRRVAAFWIVLVLALCVGTVLGFVREPFQDYGAMIHDIAAYSLLITFALLIAVWLVDPSLRRSVVWHVVSFGAVSMLLQIGSGHGLVPVPGVDPWFYDRLRGWSLDPNQFGLFLGVPDPPRAAPCRDR